MALDAFSVVLGFLAAVEIVLGGAAALLGWREFRGAASEAAEGRRPLLVLVAAAAVAAAVLSFPLHYLLLESWIPRWPGIMCVEGVRRIGTGTIGASRFLPGIVAALDITRLLVLFAAGAWWILRRSGAARRAAAAAVILGAIAVVDGGASLAYVVMPKQEILPVAGCCTVPSLGTERLAGLVAEGARGTPGSLAPAYLAATAILGGGALALRGRRPGAGAALLGILGAASLPLAAAFLAHVAAPSVLGLPYHHCAWCAFAGAPETIVGAALHLGAALCAGWAPLAGEGARRLLVAASFGFLAAGAMGAVLVALP